MRAKTSDFLKVLNRARPDAEKKEMKTISYVPPLCLHLPFPVTFPCSSFKVDLNRFLLLPLLLFPSVALCVFEAWLFAQEFLQLSAFPRTSIQFFVLFCNIRNDWEVIKKRVFVPWLTCNWNNQNTHSRKYRLSNTREYRTQTVSVCRLLLAD